MVSTEMPLVCSRCGTRRTIEVSGLTTSQWKIEQRRLYRKLILNEPVAFCDCHTFEQVWVSQVESPYVFADGENYLDILLCLK